MSFGFAGLVIILITQAVTFLAAALAFWRSLKNGGELNNLHLSLNSRLDELIASNKESAHAAGVAEERSRQDRDRPGRPS